LIGEVIYDLLSNDTDVTNALASDENGDPLISPNYNRQSNSNPYLVYQLQQLTPTYQKDKVSDLDEHEVDLIVVGKEYTETHDAATKVRDKLDRFEGDSKGHTIDRILIDNRFDNYDFDSKLHQVVTTIIIREKT
jgi:hypothetical protein